MYSKLSKSRYIKTLSNDRQQQKNAELKLIKSNLSHLVSLQCFEVLKFWRDIIKSEQDN